MISLKERAKQFDNSLPFMEGREKGEMKRITDEPFTITDYGFLKDEDDKEYVCFVVKEDPQYFYFGGQVLTENMQELEEGGYHEEISKEGLPVLFGTKISKKSKREYVTVSFYPETSPADTTKSKK
jgi:hypothetical protein